MRYTLIAVAFAVAVVPTRAAADYTQAAPVRPLTMSDPSGLSVVGLDLQYTKWNLPVPAPGADLTSLTFDLHADFVLSPHWVLFGRLPLQHASIDDNTNDACCGTGLGNVTLGGRGLWSSRDRDLRTVLGGELSLSVPTASDDGDGGTRSSLGAFSHLTSDPGRYAPNTTTIRLNFLGQLYTRWFLAHAEAGLHFFIYDSDVNRSYDSAFRLALAVGVRATYEISVLAEINSMLYTEFGPDRDATSLDLGVRYGAGFAIFGARLFLPLDAGLRDLDMLGFGLDGGWRF